ncbi:MAG TPA: RNA 2',3'-cyclic phosphodiesterase [Candidatus Udaeobacter sp.]|nr:RNA 2',3'-cyclic phosphodiesterase [Candidatus Udaeobacter sp.]
MARMFVAVRLPAAVAHELASLEQRLERSILDVRWVAEENLHFTLRFFGELDGGQVARATAAATAVAGASTGFTLEILGLGTFPPAGRPRVLWAGVGTGREALCELARELDRAFQAADLGPADRPFAPHLTLGRFRDPNPPPRRGGARAPTVPAQAVPAIRAALATEGAVRQEFRAEAVTLIESRLSPRGPSYADRAQLVLGGRPGSPEVGGG